jgi:hypothetical protein
MESAMGTEEIWERCPKCNVDLAFETTGDVTMRDQKVGKQRFDLILRNVRQLRCPRCDRVAYEVFSR